MSDVPREVVDRDAALVECLQACALVAQVVSAILAKQRLDKAELSRDLAQVAEAMRTLAEQLGRRARAEPEPAPDESRS